MMHPDLRELEAQVTRELQRVPAPTTVSTIEAELDKNMELINRLGCGCAICSGSLSSIMSTKLAMGQLLSWVSKDCENGVAAMVYRMHLVHMDNTLKGLQEVTGVAPVPVDSELAREMLVSIIKGMAHRAREKKS